jgi:hypothetical protein
MLPSMPSRTALGHQGGGGEEAREDPAPGRALTCSDSFLDLEKKAAARLNTVVLGGSLLLCRGVSHLGWCQLNKKGLAMMG